MSHTHLGPITVDNLSDIQKFITQDVPKQEEDIEVFSVWINDMVTSLTTPIGNGIDHLAILANQLANFNKGDLQTSCKAIRSYSDPLVNSLADLCGFLGPQNVLKTQLSRRLFMVEAYGGTLPHRFCPRKFVTDLVELQPQLTKLAKYLCLPKDIQDRSRVPRDAVTAIKILGKKQDVIFESRPTFQRFLTEIIRLED
ncbi:hypothetical protein PtA15_15A372 [Puccinia triticina]|uniref:Uncharacterized protein n=1 Tax=Puccinia triticina TaxID=208348 RepID=A0ABY7D2X9_9BASI|nr:uncharacterized protein PtA15_15A372 [Puccinia triticina]WAQ91979.1 hypothetical protein PtA15_15A372 [Puccinia triticina]